MFCDTYKTYTICGRNAEFIRAKLGGTYVESIARV
jgi:hypothetical protein